MHREIVGPLCLAPRDLYHLRRARLEAEAKTLLAQLEQNRLQKLTLELEYKHRLLGSEATVDVHTGVIRKKDQGSEPRPSDGG